MAERGFEQLTPLLKPSTQLPERVTVVLAGDGLGTDGTVRVSTVSLETGEVLLYRFPGAGGAYEASVVHELVHATRLAHVKSLLDSYATGIGFIEEGFAELAAMKAGSPSRGFPLYDVPIDVVAGQWLTNNDAVPLSALMRQHGTLNARCTAQAYSQRLSFFLMLDERFGWDAVRRWAFATDGATADGFARIFGVSLKSAFEAWPEWARARFSKVADAAAKADAYRRESPAKYLPVCTNVTPAESP